MKDTTPNLTFGDIYTEEEIMQISELMDTILSIRKRLISEGIDVEAEILKLQEKDSMG